MKKIIFSCNVFRNLRVRGEALSSYADGMPPIFGNKCIFYTFFHVG